MSNEESVSNEVSADEIIHQQEFGVRLREARESRGLTIHEIAEQLHLKEEIVKALESSSVDSLPAATFTQGYIRAYARLLKLPEEEILDIYNTNMPNKEVPLVPNSGMSAQSIDDGASIRPLVLVLALCFVALLAYLLIDFNSQSKVESDFQSNEQKIDNLNNDEIRAEVSELDKEVPSISTAQNEVDINHELAQAEENQDTQNTQAQTGETDVVIEADQKIESTVQEKVEEGPVDQPEIIAEEKAEIVVQGDDVLEFVTMAASWAEVQDINGHRLIFELLNKDQTYQVKGMAPFKVFLGNAPAVKMLVNNHEVDIASYIRKNNIVNITVEDNGMVKLARRDRIISNSNDENTQQESSLSDSNEVEDL